MEAHDIMKIEKSKTVNRSTRVLPDRWLAPREMCYWYDPPAALPAATALGSGLGEGMSLSSRHLGAIVAANFAIASPIGGGGRDNADVKPLGPVFGLMCPIGTACVCHDRGCGRWMVALWRWVYGGIRSRSQNSESDWLGYAFAWVTAAARRGLMALNKPLPRPGNNCRAGGEGLVEFVQ